MTTAPSGCCVLHRGLGQRELQFLDFGPLPALDEVPAAGALTARHPVFHRGLARIDEAVAPPIDRLRRDAVAAGGLGNRQHDLQPRFDRHRVVGTRSLTIRTYVRIIVIVKMGVGGISVNVDRYIEQILSDLPDDDVTGRLKRLQYVIDCLTPLFSKTR